MSTHNIGEAILMSNNIGFYEDLTKIILELSSNMHLISSAASAFFKHTVKTDQTGQTTWLI